MNKSKKNKGKKNKSKKNKSKKNKIKKNKILYICLNSGIIYPSAIHTVRRIPLVPPTS